MAAASPRAVGAEPRDRRCARGLRKEISAESKRTYIKAFIVWAVCTLAGWISIPPEFLPLFSHCVGFGFFITITTRKTRWLFALAIGAIILTVLLYQTTPFEWIPLTTQSAGYGAIGVMLIIASLWTVVPDGMRRDIISKRDEMVQLGSEYILHMKDSLIVAGSATAAGAVSLYSDADARPGGPAVASMRAELEALRGEFAAQLKATGERLREELERRVALEKELGEAERRAEAAAAEAEAARRRADKLKDTSNSLKVAQRERDRLQQLLRAAKRQLQEDNAALAAATTRADRLEAERKAMDLDLQELRERCARMLRTAAVEVQRSEEEAAALREARAILGLAGGEEMGAFDLGELERRQEAALARVRALKAAAVDRENALLRQVNEELQGRMSCRVCLTEPVGVVLMPCNHLCLCKECALRIRTCPLCRRQVQSSRQVYMG